MVQSEQHVILWLTEGVASVAIEALDDVEKHNGQQLPCVEAHKSRP